MPEIEIQSTTPFVSVDAKRQMVVTTFVVYKTKDGKVGAITVPKESPTVADVEEAIKKRAAVK